MNLKVYELRTKLLGINNIGQIPGEEHPDTVKALSELSISVRDLCYIIIAVLQIGRLSEIIRDGPKSV